MLQKKLGISDSNYRGLLWNGYKVESSKDMNTHQARELIRDMEEQAIKAGVWEKKKSPRNKLKYSDHPENEVLASRKQKRMLNAIWNTSDAVRTKTDEAFESFVCRIANVDHFKWLQKKDVQKVKLAIEKLK
ncbi:MAG: DUF1018 domain-containing protein [Candidatus Abawacabacteria bacterium]|nr:DUF1018 domain-containing protein [Candidatus Abawacabacteria bacterium]